MIELGANVLTDEVLKKFLSPDDFNEFCIIKKNKMPISASLANALAEAMKTWAMQAGATHYTHWFFPLTEKTAGKQISFFEKTDGQFIANFEGKHLIKGETDASSFPSGGERMTFEARGYTVWDYTSQTILYENKNGEKILLLPTAFCSYRGTALDEKTPLLRAQKRLDEVSVAILHELGKNDVSHVESLVGGEQEYFLIDRSAFLKRADLVLTGRTLLGARATKTQDQHHHYFGTVSTRVAQFFKQVNDKLWRMGVVAKLQHNEVAPCQHELVPMYAPSNLSSDQNQLIMQVLCEQADALGMTVLLHEKPFMGMNGSGKHTNWSLATDTGLGLLDASENDQVLFLLFFTAVLAAIAKHAGLLKLCATHWGNELRLGGDEAPPALVSVFIGDDLQTKLKQILADEIPTQNTPELLHLGVPSLSPTFKDNCDRNRTSPFAYTGNKFEFRMVGSGQSLAFPCMVLNTLVADQLTQVLQN